MIPFECMLCRYFNKTQKGSRELECYTSSTKGKNGQIEWEFKQMTGLEFEEYCADVLRSNGYTGVKVTKASGDQGILALRNVRQSAKNT